VIDGAAVDNFPVINGLIGGFVDEVEYHLVKGAGGDKDSAFRLVKFVAYLIGEDSGGLGLGLRSGGRGLDLALRPESRGLGENKDG